MSRPPVPHVVRVAGLAVLLLWVEPATLRTQPRGIDPRIPSLVQSARADINAFWARTIKGYLPPADVVMVTAPTNTDCGPFERPNAAYCSSTNKIYWDSGMFTTQYRIGDFAPVFILAHEWGHMVQRMLGFWSTEKGLLSIQLELQADCFAGEYAADARARKVLDPGDDDEATLSLRRAGDRLDSPWFDSNAHGTAGQRIDAFTYGFEGRDCAAPGFFEFLKGRGIDPARAPQTPAPTAGGLASLLPKQAGRFTMTDVKRMKVEGATDALEAVYKTSDGIAARCRLSAFPSVDLSQQVLTEAIRILKEKHAYTEVRRQNIVDRNTRQPIGLVVTFHGQNEIVVWTNRHTLTLLEGPRDITFELYNSLPF